jgi:hypothetical protein
MKLQSMHVDRMPEEPAGHGGPVGSSQTRRSGRKAHHLEYSSAADLGRLLVTVRVEEARVALRGAGSATSIRRSSSMRWPGCRCHEKITAEDLADESASSKSD